MHIQEAQAVYGNTARDLAGAHLDADPYHKNIRDAARAMVDAGLGDWEYFTQYASGNSMWYTALGGRQLVTSMDEDYNFVIPEVNDED